MPTFAHPRRTAPQPRTAVLVLALLAAWPLTSWSQADRDRQQMQQLQQMVQKLRQDNADLQQRQAKAVEQVKSEAQTQLQRETARARSGSAASQREAKRLADELAQAQQALAAQQAEAEKLKAELAQRDGALRSATQQAEAERAVTAADRKLLGTRLKVNAERADVCEAKHADAYRLASELLDLHATRQLRACEPFTGLWRVGEEDKVQALRDRLFETRLDLPPAAAPATDAVR